MKDKKYYSSEEFRKKIKTCIVENWDQLKNDIKLEKKYISNDSDIYV